MLGGDVRARPRVALDDAGELRSGVGLEVRSGPVKPLPAQVADGYDTRLLVTPLAHLHEQTGKRILSFPLGAVDSARQLPPSARYSVSTDVHTDPPSPTPPFDRTLHERQATTSGSGRL